MTEVTNQPKRKRRWLRFSLRTFLIVVTIFCVWFGWYLYRVEQQKEAVKWVKENGGTVTYEFELNRYGYPERVTGAKPPGPNWLHDILGVHYFASVEAVELFFKEQISDLTPLAGLTNLEQLSLLSTEVRDLKPLTGLTNLERLLLIATPVTDLKPLAGLTNLEELYLENTRVSNLKPLAGLTNLERLSLIETPVSDLKPLAGLTNLKLLWLHNTQVSDEEIEKLRLALPNCDISR